MVQRKHLPWFIFMFVLSGNCLGRQLSLAQNPISAPPSLAAETAKLDDLKLDKTPSPTKKQLLELAVNYYNQGKLDDAAVLYRTVLTFNNNDIDANYNLGVIAERQGRLDEAKRYYRQALSLKPDDNEIQQALNSVQNKSGRSGTEYNYQPANPIDNSQVANDAQSSLVASDNQTSPNPDVSSSADSNQKSNGKSTHLLSGILKFSIGATAKCGVTGIKAIIP